MLANVRRWLNKALSLKRMAQGAVIIFFSGIHFALCAGVGAAIALQHEDPNPETEEALKSMLHWLREPLANPLIDTFSLDGLIYYPAYGLNSLLWGLTAYLVCYAVFVGLRWLWNWLSGAEPASA